MNSKRSITRLAMDLPNKDVALSLARKIVQARGCVVVVSDELGASFSSMRAERSANRIEKLTLVELQKMVDEVDDEIKNATRH